MDTTQLWDYIKESLATDQTIETNIYNSYIAPSKLEKHSNMEFFLVVKSIIAKNYLSDLLLKINDLIKTQLNHNVNLKIYTTSEYNNFKKTEEIDNKKSDYKFSFDSFVVGFSNEKAYQAAKRVTQNLGILWNPLFIYGDSGLGKTHLLRAIEHEINTNGSGLKAIYLESSDFGAQVIDVISKGHQEIEDYKNKLKEYDVLLVDDIQFLAKREKTNEILFVIFNSFIENDKQIVITSDKGPEQLNGFDQRMITRFNSGLSVPVKAPDLDTAIAIITEELEGRLTGFQLDDEAITYIATYYSNDIRKIKGIINKIMFWNETSNKQNKKVVNLKDVQEILKDVNPSTVGKLNTSRIKEVVGSKYGVSVKQIDGKTRTAVVTNARHLAMYLTKDILDLSYVQIGNDFGNKDHTTVLNAVDKIKNKIEADKDFKNLVSKTKNEIISN